MSKVNIFPEFNEVSAKGWRQKIQMDLKGADYNKTLLSGTLEGITIQPFYHKKTHDNLRIPIKNTSAKICQTLFINNENIVNNIAKEALQKGAESIRFIADDIFDFKLLFNKLPLENNYIIICNFLDYNFFKELSTLSKTLNISIVIDVIHHFLKEGNWHKNQLADFDTLHDLVKLNAITIGINSSLYQNSGANIVQQISYSLAHVNEYLNIFKEKETELNFIFSFAIGSNYFFEISKIRAFRYLITKLLSEYDFKANVEIILEPTLRNKTLYDYNVNMLRTTTESMAAMLCGADFISNTSYDAIYHRSNEFGTRIARNQLLILKEESYFSKENNIANGSYYIEQITYEIADKSLSIFKDIEKTGGFLVQIQQGTIQRKIEESANKEQQLFDNDELILLGTNKYPNPQDKMKNDLELYPFIKTKPRKTIIKPLIPKRLAEKLEQKRLKEE